MMPETATPPEAAMLRPMDIIEDSSVAARFNAPPDLTVESFLTRDCTLLVITLPNPVKLTATSPEAPTPAVRAMILASERAVNPTAASGSVRMKSDSSSPSSASYVMECVAPARTVESSILDKTVLAMTLPMMPTLTAVVPEPATLTMTARMLASRSTGESSRLSLSSVEVSEGRIHSGMLLGAISCADRDTSPAA